MHREISLGFAELLGLSNATSRCHFCCPDVDGLLTVGLSSVLRLF